MNAYSFRQVFDAAHRRVRGLWLRNGTYHVQCTRLNPSTGLKTVTKLPLPDAKTLEQAKIQAAAVKDRAAKGELLAGDAGPTFGEYREHYLKTNHKAKTTIKNEDNFLSSWERFLGADYRLRQISAQNILGYRTSMLKRSPRPLKERSVNLHCVALKQMLTLAKVEGKIDKLPFHGITQLKFKPEERPLLDEQTLIDIGTEAIMNHARTGIHFAYYIALLMYSGARCSEALQLKWSDIDWQNEAVVFRGEISKGEGRRTSFNKNLKNVLLVMKAKAENDYLFPSERTNTHVISFKKIMEEIREKLGIHFHFHLTRHYFISKCVMSNINFMSIARWVGHKDGGILIGKVYGHVTDQHLKEQANKLII